MLSLATLAVSFGCIEGAVVIYLRQIFYPHGFSFPLVPIPWHLLRVEMIREAATLTLLLGAAGLAARSPIRRFGAFAFAFGVWDLVYYLTLEVALGWPRTVLDWDILFLLPMPWVGPVLSPVLVAIALVLVGAVFFVLPEDQRPRITRVDWWVEIAAGCIVLAAFLWNGPEILAGRNPTGFPWTLFLVGYLGGWAWFIYRWLSADRSNS
ncbi:MAG: hypothetical protein KC729_07740 [Candidatus Eisenbacteria bacterium]|uniref:Uncharacterized protein n=1 Tax=Eiseniibacteriota bacterium TaxID=2212470 RepID=A0A956RQG0_UNCEI|nr:hypothetical protein [Candidatus Eisenbacteria bacterium]